MRTTTKGILAGLGLMLASSTSVLAQELTILWAEWDPANYLQELVNDYQKETGASILLASHNMVEVERLCSQVLLMQTGRIVERGSPQELIGRYGRDTMEEVFLDIARGRGQFASSGTMKVAQ